VEADPHDVTNGRIALLSMILDLFTAMTLECGAAVDVKPLRKLLSEQNGVLFAFQQYADVSVSAVLCS
jgi:hypothetical protein